jgi:hypothetical protein
MVRIFSLVGKQKNRWSVHFSNPVMEKLFRKLPISSDSLAA